eukprot:g6486.t1
MALFGNVHKDSDLDPILGGPECADPRVIDGGGGGGGGEDRSRHEKQPGEAVVWDAQYVVQTLIRSAPQDDIGGVSRLEEEVLSDLIDDAEVEGIVIMEMACSG